jgi:hypothetical protein
MIAQDEQIFVTIQRRSANMKRLMSVMLGLCLAFGTVAIVAAHDAPKKETEKKSGKKKGGKKKEESPKKEGGR